MKSIGLSMIVKNEAEIISACLASTLPLVDYILVVDTGSTDGTQNMISDFLRQHNIPGAVIEEPWRDFAYNRTFALQTLRKVATIDYALVMDADDRMVFETPFDSTAFKAQLWAELYDIEIRHRGTRFHRPQLFSSKLEFSYKAVLHEYLEAPKEGCTRATVEGFYIETSRGGARSQNPRKYEDDAAVLETALKAEADPFLISRYYFYLAQSYRDSNQPELALRAYLKRAELGYWSEEVFESLYSAGQMLETLKSPASEVCGTYLLAYEHAPQRVESLHALVRYCNWNGMPKLGYFIGKQAITRSQPSTGLFIKTWIYDYGMLDEFAIAAYWAGEYRDCIDACLRLLNNPRLPPESLARITQNAQFARDRLREQP